MKHLLKSKPTKLFITLLILQLTKIIFQLLYFNFYTYKNNFHYNKLH